MIKKAFWDLTYKCNGNCIYCFTNAGSWQPSGLNLNKKKKIADIVLAHGVKKISFGGGEPFIESDFVDLCDYIGNRGKISLTTNASILNRKILDFLDKSECNITVSIDTLNKRRFETIRKGLNFENIISNVKEMARHERIRKRLSVRCTVCSINQDDIEEILKFCNDNGIHKLKINTMNPFGRAKMNQERILDFNKFVELTKMTCCNHYTDIKIELPIAKYLDKDNYKCTMGFHSIYINPDGNIFPCAFSNGWHNMGNLLLDSNVWKHLMLFSHHNEFCENCLVHRYERKKVAPL